MIKNISRVMVVGTGSDSGKTTVTCALLQALILKGYNVKSFKCGPDYIDPMFHSKIIGAQSKNLDMFLCDENTIKNLLAYDNNADLSIIEGVMGMYDGMNFTDDTYSANHISKVTQTDEIIVVNPKGKSVSLLAEIQGFLNFKKNRLKGVILNQCSKGMYSVYKKLIEDNTDLKVYGYLPKIPEASIGSRHLGLITAMEIEDIKEKMLLLGNTAIETLDLDGIIRLGQKESSLEYDEIIVKPIVENKVKIAVAYDQAFSFYYEDNLRLLRQLGAELDFFSPIKDDKLPEDTDGIILGGGYPELHLKELSENREIMKAIREKNSEGLPIWAECGGFMYLGKSISVNGKSYETVGLIESEFHMTDKLVRFGYQRLAALKDNIMCKNGESINCHEFHRSDADFNGEAFLGRKTNGKEWKSIIANDNLFAGYPHLHLWSNMEFAKNFIKACSKER